MKEFQKKLKNGIFLQTVDKESDIPAMTIKAILLTIPDRIESGEYDVKDLHNDYTSYKKS
ncbi:hypothetical protein [Gilliamella sp. wkB308]|uniref:hypothetical protein n=1 Tax=Gilliamella sp. wkB308 TaxID=3120263 RepID=UPI00080E6AC7|nr:hypothetical protein [Gilliamella apicola]OCG01718.1 hypothetical protein A9G10_03075 [Gilliamella apicola]